MVEQIFHVLSVKWNKHILFYFILFWHLAYPSHESQNSKWSVKSTSLENAPKL